MKNIRDEWQKQKPEKGSAHPFGASQRSVVWAQLMIIWQSQYCELIKNAPTHGIPAVRHGEPSVKQGAPGYDISLEALQQSAEAIDRLAAIPIPDVEKNCIQAPPKISQPCGNGRQTMGMDSGSCSIGKLAKSVRDVETAASYAAKPSAIKMEPQISQDGPLVKQLIAQIKGKGKGKGKNACKSAAVRRDHGNGQNKKKRKGGDSWWDYQEDEW